MALQRKSVLQKLLITFEPDGKYVGAEALFQVGAWDTELNDWVGTPTLDEQQIHTMIPEGKKALNDVLGLTVVKAIEAVELWKKCHDERNEAAKGAMKETEAVRADLKDAIGARNNYAALEKFARGDLMTECQRRDEIINSQRDLAARVPRLIRRLFGAI
jgi:hypothetical protein